MRALGGADRPPGGPHRTNHAQLRKARVPLHRLQAAAFQGCCP